MAAARVRTDAPCRIPDAGRVCRLAARARRRPSSRNRNRVVACQHRSVRNAGHGRARLLGANACLGHLAGVGACAVDALGRTSPRLGTRHSHADSGLRRFIGDAAGSRRSPRGLHVAAAPAACAARRRRRAQPAPRRRQRSRVVRSDERRFPRRAHVAGVVCDDDGRPGENRGAFLQARARLPAAVLLDGVRARTGGHARVALADSQKRALSVPRRDFLGGRHYAALGSRNDLDSLLDRLRKELPDGRAGPQEKHPRGHPLHRQPWPRRSPARRIRLSRGSCHKRPRARRRCPLLSALGTSPRGRIR